MLQDGYATRATGPDRLDLAAEDVATWRLVGEAVLTEYDAAAGTRNLRCLVGPESRGRGLGTEAVRLPCSYALDVLGPARLELLEHDPRARHVHQGLGSVPTGRRPGAVVFEGAPIAALDLALTAEGFSASPR